MADPLLTSHKLVESMALPYASFITPIEDSPYIAAGFNVMTSIKRVMERRPGFAGRVEKILTTQGGVINNIYTWHKWGLPGRYFIMLSVATSSTSRVMKLEIGIDSSFVQLLEVSGTVPFDFWAQANTCFMGNGTDGSMMQYDGQRLVSWGIARPTIPPVGNLVTVPKGIDCQTDYHLRYTYWDDTSGHESSASDVNDCLGVFTNMGIQWSVWASPNPRVTHIRLYRTRDGGSTDPRQMQEITQSPIPNVDSTVTDYTEDADLKNNFAPGLTINDPPPPLRGLVGTTARIFGFNNDETWYSGFDEVTNGMQEECFKGAADRQLSGNYYRWNDGVSALEQVAGADAGMAVFLPGSIQMVSGELRNELSRFPVEQLYGARGAQGTAHFGADVGWYDISGQVRTKQVGELSQDIRGEMAKLDAVNVQLDTHIAAFRKWITVLDPDSGTLYVYDLDTHIWQTPWHINATALHSGEIAPGERVLFAAIAGQVWYMVEGAYNDAGTPYAAEMRTGLVPVAPKDNPDVVQILDAVSIERNDTGDVADILISFDESPQHVPAYASIKKNEGDPTYRRKGQKLVERRYTIDPGMDVARRVSIYLKWAAVDSPFELYSINAEHHPEES